MINESILRLVDYAQAKGLIEESDRIYSINKLLDALELHSFEEVEYEGEKPLNKILEEIVSYAQNKGLIEEGITASDLFDTKLMALLTPRPSEVIRKFNSLYSESPKAATDFFYDLSRNTNYIRRDRIEKDLKWTCDTEYGSLDITINLSKPEKDPKAIAAAKNAVQSGYPKCMLCKENEGYSGRINYPARGNHRVIPIKINNQNWCLQYSPYVYYNEHCIVFNSEHSPMAINEATFKKLLDFVALFPHYFVGSNADLPIVGGSILSHDHFQGGSYSFAMEKAPVETEVSFEGFEDIKAGILRWPMSVIRLNGSNPDRIIELSSKVLDKWRNYSDKSAFIISVSDGEPHNTITPIARRRGENYEMDLVLRNNITTDEHPLGVYHPHKELHHIKKENIGLIEVMGLAVLPSRLKEEISILKDALINNEDISSIEKISSHADWAEELKKKYTFSKDNAEEILKKEIGMVFSKVLEHAGVFKRTDEGKKAFLRFIDSIK